MTTTTVYLATPIDLRRLLFEPPKLPHLAIYRPGWAWFVADPECQPRSTVQEVNQHAVRACDGLVGVLLADHPSIGVPVEIEWAVALGKPVAIVTDLRSKSWLLPLWDQRSNVTVVDVTADTVADGVAVGCRWVMARTRLKGS